MFNSTVELFNHVAGMGDCMICPRCGSENLHQKGVTVFDRTEDADETQVTKVDNGTIISQLLPSLDCGNPSRRRHGLTVGFSCENCGDGLVLNIAQHKELTFIMWTD